MLEPEWRDAAPVHPDLFPYIDNPPQSVVADEPLASEEDVLQTATGRLTAAQIEQILAALPVDMTLVDGQDRVRFFSRPKERIFPRSPAIIGRQVAHCHPPQSVDKVLSIIEAFRQGRENQATFWIRHRGRFPDPYLPAPARRHVPGSWRSARISRGAPAGRRKAFARLAGIKKQHQGGAT